MRGLIYKDLLIIYKKTSVLSVTCIVVTSLIFVVIFKSSAVSLLSILLPFMFTGLSYNLFIQDDKNNWEKYVRTIPLSKIKIVGARYLSSIITLNISIFYMFILNICAFLIFQEQSLKVYLIILFIGSICVYIYLLIFLTANYILGINSKNIVGTIVLIFITMIIYLTKNNFNNDYISYLSSIPINTYILFSIIICIFLTMKSFYLSLQGFQNKKVY